MGRMLSVYARELELFEKIGDIGWHRHVNVVFVVVPVEGETTEIFSS